jgi:hypothetical protein
VELRGGAQGFFPAGFAGDAVDLEQGSEEEEGEAAGEGEEEGGAAADDDDDAAAALNDSLYALSALQSPGAAEPSSIYAVDPSTAAGAPAGGEGEGDSGMALGEDDD